MKHYYWLILAVFLAAFAQGCEQEGPAEKAGEKVDEAVEETGDKIEETGEAIEKKTDN